MARGQKVNFEISSLGSEELLQAVFAPMNVFIRATYRINGTIPTVYSAYTPVSFTVNSGGIQISQVVLEDAIPENAHIRSFEFAYTDGRNAFFHLNLAEGGGGNIIIFTQQGLLFIERIKIVVGGA